MQQLLIVFASCCVCEIRWCGFYIRLCNVTILG
jgi:hypothetical protein